MEYNNEICRNKIGIHKDKIRKERIEILFIEFNRFISFYLK